jgi:tetratricopeptide (TPR) repeat protein
MNLQLIVHLIERAGRLFGLALAPALLPPEPAVSANPSLVAIIVVVAFALVVVAALRLRARVASREALLACALVILSIAASFACAAYFRDARAPLGRGVLVVAVPLWVGLSIAVWAALRKRFQDQPVSKHALVALATLGVGLAQLAASASWIGSVDRMWWVTLLRDGNSARALDELTKTNHDVSYALALVDRCITTNSTHCTCLAKRSDIRRRSRDVEAALVDARLASTTCPNDASTNVALVVALVAKGEATQAEEVARAALDRHPTAKLHYALAVALEGQGRLQDAAASARRAVELGAGRDAELLVAALAILAGDLDAATTTLTALVAASPNDAEARYNLALVADKKNDYNRAREGYLAALKVDPTLINARYNLALLTLRRGVVDEARHHARKFAEAAPGDPRIAELMRRVDAAKPSRP